MRQCPTATKKIYDLEYPSVYCKMQPALLAFLIKQRTDSLEDANECYQGLLAKQPPIAFVWLRSSWAYGFSPLGIVGK